LHDLAGFGAWEERRKDLLREADERRLARGLREARKELPASGWRRVFALLGTLTVPFFGAFSAGRGNKQASP
jgi:hypothetical protein